MSIIRDMPLAEYHTRDAVSHTRLADYARSPRLYYDAWVGKTISDFEAEAEDVKGARLFGQAFEDLLFTPADFLAKYAIKPEGPAGDGRTKEGKAWNAANSGRPALSPREHRKLEYMVSAIHEHPEAMAMIAECEQQVTLDCRIHGSLLQSRPDLICLQGSAISDFRPYAADLKTTEKLERFLSGRAIVEYGYHRQAEIAGICMFENDVGVTAAEFAHYNIVVEKVVPHRVAVIDLSRWLPYARSWVFRQLAGIEACANAGYWPRSKPGITELPVPQWVTADSDEDAA